MMFKIIGCAVIIFCGFGVGLVFKTNLKLRVEEIESVIYMGEYMSTQIKYNTPPLPDLFDEMCQSSKLQNLKFIPICSQYMKNGKSFPESFENSILDSKKDMHLHIDDINTVLGLKNELGTTYIDGQLKTLMLFGIQMRELLETAKEQYKINGSMYQKLSVLVGVGISILLF